MREKAVSDPLDTPPRQRRWSQALPRRRGFNSANPKIPIRRRMIICEIKGGEAVILSVLYAPLRHGPVVQF